jgi:hypothetical protein
MHGICTKYETNMQKICEIYRKYALNMQDICKKYAENLTKMHISCIFLCKKWKYTGKFLHRNIFKKICKKI